MRTINWNKIVKEASLKKLQDFCEGNLTYKEFESFGPTCRSSIRTHRTKRLRQLASQAVRRRTS